MSAMQNTTTLTLLEQPQRPSTEKVIEQVVLADGNIHLAAERLTLTTSIVYDILSDEQAMDMLKRQLQIRSLFTMYKVVKDSSLMVTTALDAMEPYEVAMTYLKAQSLLNEELKKEKAPAVTSFTNNVQLAIATLPPEVQEALRVLQSNTTVESQVIEDNDNDIADASLPAVQGELVKNITNEDD